MKRSLFLLVTALVLSMTLNSAAENVEPDIDRAYTILKEAYPARKSGNEDLSREKMALALSLFRQAAGARSPSLINPGTEYILEESPRNINLIENKTLFKIEFKTGPPAPDTNSPESQTLIRQQQLILQKLIQLTRENVELKQTVLRIESETREIDNISDTVSLLQDATDGLSELESRLDDIKDTTDDIITAVDKVADRHENDGQIENIADEVSDLRDDSDILKDILNVVEDIKGDTDEIKDLEDKLDDVKDAAAERNE
jgi:uncharacterized phage infection (PIP) family protein YhgE